VSTSPGSVSTSPGSVVYSNKNPIKKNPVKNNPIHARAFALAFVGKTKKLISLSRKDFQLWKTQSLLKIG